MKTKLKKKKKKSTNSATRIHKRKSSQKLSTCCRYKKIMLAIVARLSCDNDAPGFGGVGEGGDVILYRNYYNVITNYKNANLT